MSDSDGEIEYLEEDAEIVQQCVQTVPEKPAAIMATAAALDLTEKLTPLLVERPNIGKRKKKKKDEEDSDYDPSEDFMPPSPPSPPSPRSKKKKGPPIKKPKEYHRIPITPDLQKNEDQNVKGNKRIHLLNRKKCNIRIPDYDDPLCLPVRAVKQEPADFKRLENWNNVCIEHFKHCDMILKPERGETKSSTRTVVFRNVVNKHSGKVETSIYSKTCVKNKEDEGKAEIFQCVLPRYKEKKVLTMYNLSIRKPKQFNLVDEVVLTKEDQKDRETLVAYKPREALSAVYTLVDNSKSKSQNKEDADQDEDEVKTYLKELTCCKVCAPCFQTSWRGVNKNQKKSLICPICARSYVTVYNLLAHFKTHSSSDMQKFKRIISTLLADIVDYHYKCRMCREKFTSIKLLRQHVTTHQGNEPFFCDVGNHMSR